VGHTTPNTCRLWIRAGDPSDAKSTLSEDRRTIGVITVLDKDRPVPTSSTRTAYFRLHREYDRTGTFVLGAEEGIRPAGKPFALKPDTAYRVRMGTLALDDAFHNDEIVSDEELARRLPPARVWANELFKLPAEKSEAVFRTFKRNDNGVSFLLGSCHYPGLFWKKKHSDRIFWPMIQEMEKNRLAGNPRFVLMVGDQIYADMFNRMIPIGLADTFEEYQDRYHDAFGSPNIRRLLRSVPQYMILDDHEIEDNWSQDRIADDRNKRATGPAIRNLTDGCITNLIATAFRFLFWTNAPSATRMTNRVWMTIICWAGLPCIPKRSPPSLTTFVSG
jgi:alkaline phosphatase D